MGDHIADTQAKRERDAKAFHEADDNLCMLCHAHGADKRSLFISCFYDIKEAVPEALDITDAGIEPFKRGYFLRVCKQCRGEFLDMLKVWRKERVSLRSYPKSSDGYLLDEE